MPTTHLRARARSRQTATRRTNPRDQITRTSTLRIILHDTNICDKRLRKLPTERLTLLQAAFYTRAPHSTQTVISVAALRLARFLLGHLHEETAAFLRVDEDVAGFEVGV